MKVPWTPKLRCLPYYLIWEPLPSDTQGLLWILWDLVRTKHMLGLLTLPLFSLSEPLINHLTVLDLATLIYLIYYISGIQKCLSLYVDFYLACFQDVHSVTQIRIPMSRATLHPLISHFLLIHSPSTDRCMGCSIMGDCEEYYECCVQLCSVIAFPSLQSGW